MRKLVKGLMLASMVVLLAGCNCYKKMLKKVDQVSISATPAVLTLKGSNVVTDVTVTFPAKYFNKKATLKVTPRIGIRRWRNRRHSRNTCRAKK